MATRGRKVVPAERKNVIAFSKENFIAMMVENIPDLDTSKADKWFLKFVKNVDLNIKKVLSYSTVDDSKDNSIVFQGTGKLGGLVKTSCDYVDDVEGSRFFSPISRIVDVVIEDTAKAFVDYVKFKTKNKDKNKVGE